MNSKSAFSKGFKKIPLGLTEEVKSKIMSSLKITSRPAWLRRLNGNVDPKLSEIEAVENVFAEYGIEKTEVWGE